MNDINKLGDLIRDVAYESYKHYWETDSDVATGDREYERIDLLKTVTDFLDPDHSYDFQSAYDDELIYQMEMEEYYASLEGNPIAEEMGLNNIAQIYE